MKSIIRVENLGKQYRIGQCQAPYVTLRESLVQAAVSPINRLRRAFGQNGNGSADSTSHIWALKDVSFEVKPGEVVGIIGRNGAGKSTLLKVLSRITEPTTGGADLYGRLASLLEVGTAFFHAELTGRENIFLAGAILGMKRREITSKFDEIVEFADIGPFLDTPVKRYSSGMYVRLGFAVAAFLESEILLVDEVLAVGDLSFQKKCLGKMGDVARQGRTVLFVSHNMVAVQALCRRAIWLDAGCVARDGPSKAVVRDYLRTASATVAERTWEAPTLAPGNEYVRLRAARLVPPPGVTAETLDVTTPFALEFEYWNLRPVEGLCLSLFLYNSDNVCVFSSISDAEPGWNDGVWPAGLYRSRCSIPSALLNDRDYHVSLYVNANGSRAIWWIVDVLRFEVHDDTSVRGRWYGDWPGIVRPALSWITSPLGATKLEEVDLPPIPFTL
jgi:lipopolysaccharide transport system ATP-binding protein